jgi:uncharacterized protein YndB with AHSA1/START domain
MSKATVEHATITLERRFRASPARVFSAWADATERKRWDVPGEGWVVVQHEQDFRVGGREVSRFGPREDPQYYSEGSYLEILQDRRIISAGTMRDKGGRTTATLNTVELIPEGEGTKLVLTDQSAFFGGERPADRQGGWEQILDRLERYLKG